jgi:hypothetical protein
MRLLSQFKKRFSQENIECGIILILALTIYSAWIFFWVTI